MKNINNFLALSLLLCVGSINTIHAQEDTSNQYTYVEYDNKDAEVLCQSILSYDIDVLKGLIVQGKEIAAIKFLIPEFEIDEGLQEYYASVTFLHLLLEEIDFAVLEDLKEVFNENIVAVYRAKLAELIKYAISIGIDLNAEKSDGDTALHIAIENGAVDMVELLIESGANVNHQDAFGLSVLHQVVAEQAETLFLVTFFTALNPSCLLQDDEELFAQVKNREKIIEILIKNGANLSIKDLDGQTVVDYIDLTTTEVNEVFNGVSSINICGFIIDIFNKKDLHNSLIVFKNELEALRKLLQK
jgi:hypothetical protein